MNTPFTFCDSPIEIIPSSRRVPNFVVDMEEEHMELIQQKQIVKVTYATHWIQMENVQYANSIGSAANVRSLYALFGGYSHNSEVFE